MKKPPKNDFDPTLFDPSLIDGIPQLQNIFRLEENLFDLDETKINETVKLINEKFIGDQKKIIVDLVDYVAEHRHLMWPILSELISKLPTPTISLNCTNFVNYLVKTGSLNEKSCKHKVITPSTAEDLEHQYGKFTVERCIRDDDVERLKLFIAERTFTRSKVPLNNKEVSLMSFAAYYSAFKCFQFLFLNDNEITMETVENAVKGGCKPIIEIIKQKGSSFRGTFSIAVQYHHNKDGRWILEEYGMDPIDLFFCVKNYNTLAFAFLATNQGYVLDKNLDNMTPLMYCAELGRLDLLKHLISLGAHISSKSKIGITALLYATKNGHNDVVECLLENGASTEEADTSGTTAIILAASKGYTNIVETLIKHHARINHRNKNKISALNKAMCHEHIQTVKILLENGANIEEKLKDNATPLIYAASNGHLELVKCLIKHGANVNAREKHGGTPLMFAAQQWYMGIIQILLKNGADASLQDLGGLTAADHTYSEEIKEVLNRSMRR